jgi:poly-gamma-glutamate synthesis protein (capsule biosynthesis protein)
MVNKLFIALIFILLALASIAGSSGNQDIPQPANPDDHQTVNEQFREYSLARQNLPSRQSPITLIAVGDVMLSRGVAGKMNAKGNDYPFRKVADYLSTADLVFGNLECSITPGRKIGRNEMVFHAAPGVESTLKSVGFDVVSLANNHMPDFGKTGIINTIKYLDEAGIAHTGAGENASKAFSPAYVEVRGVRFAFLAYNDTDVVPDSYEATNDHHGTAIMNIDTLTKAVTQAKLNSDFTVVSMHSGYEYKFVPNKAQVNFAHAAIDSGADLVLGHHPHVVQTLEKYNGKYILYSLGNFVFDQMWSQKTREGMVAKIYISDKKVEKIEFVTVQIDDYCQPKIVSGEQEKSILAKLKTDLKERTVFKYDSEEKKYAKVSRKVIYDFQPSVSNQCKNEFGNCDLDKNFLHESFLLDMGKLSIIENEKTIFESNNNWWIDDFEIADSTNTNRKFLNLSVWRSGNFGSSKPFWIPENDMSVKNHLFVMKYEKRGLRPIWQSSNLSSPIIEMEFADVDLDGKTELVVIEGDYNNPNFAKGKYISIWRWNEWGFFTEWRSNPGEYSNLEIQSLNGETVIVADNRSV